MSGYLVKLYQKCKHLLNDKGQGLVEFALTIAFCAIIGYAVSEMGFIEALRGAYNTGNEAYLTADIGGGKTQASGSGGETGGESGGGSGGGGSTEDKSSAGVGPSGFKWGFIVPDEYYNKEYKNENATTDGGNTTVDFTAQQSKDDRLLADQKALENLAQFFLGKTQGEVAGYLKNANQAKYSADMGNVHGYNEELLLGHFKPLYNDKTKVGMKFVSNQLVDSLAQEILKWMINPSDPGSVNMNDYMDADGNIIYNFLVSDYVVSQGWVTGSQAGNIQGCGLKLRLEYDYSEKYGTYESADQVKVIGVHVAIDPRSQFNSVAGTSQYNGISSLGLDIQLRLDDEGKPYVTKYNTGIKAEDEPTASHLGMYNWYGEGDYRQVKKLIDNNVSVTLDSQNPVVTKTFEPGEIIKIVTKDSNNKDVIKYYIAFQEKELTVSYTSSQSSLEYKNTNSQKSNIFVKFTGYDTNYFHENDKTSYEGGHFNKIKIGDRGYLMTLNNGDSYVYVGKTTPVYVNSEDVKNSEDWIFIGNVIPEDHKTNT